jgi:hypothetical protein
MATASQLSTHEALVHNLRGSRPDKRFTACNAKRIQGSPHPRWSNPDCAVLLDRLSPPVHASIGNLVVPPDPSVRTRACSLTCPPRRRASWPRSRQRILRPRRDYTAGFASSACGAIIASCALGVSRAHSRISNSHFEPDREPWFAGHRRGHILHTIIVFEARVYAGSVSHPAYDDERVYGHRHRPAGAGNSPAAKPVVRRGLGVKCANCAGEN